MPAIRNSRQLMAGVLFLLIGTVVFVTTQTYDIGTATSMGPGYFPMMLSVVLIALGAIAFLQAAFVDHHDALAAPKIAPLVFVLAGLVLFALLIDKAGLPAAVITLVVVSCYDRLRQRPLEVVAIALALAAFTSVLFIYLLKLPLRLY